MTDITERLRRLYVQHGTDYVQAAADEIERLRDALTRRSGLYTRLAEVHEGAMKMWESDERECAMKAYEMAAELKGLREEVERLRAELAKADGQINRCVEQNKYLESTISRLRDALSRYAYHEEDCAAVDRGLSNCDCGYDELMAELEETK